MRFRRNHQRGNALIEFALASAILIPAMVGSFQFGFTFYRYNLLESAVSNGSRYAAYRTYRCLNGATDINKVKAAIQNATVYNTPSPGTSPVPVLPGLKPSDINVTYTLSATQVPVSVTINVKSYAVNALFSTYTFNNKPKITAPYLGRYAPEESEP
jgi:Flp pilus assembly protein TadG